MINKKYLCAEFQNIRFMIQHFENLTPEEFGSLKDALLRITILIAGADGTIDENETDWAEKLTEIRGYAHRENLRDFYDEVHLDFLPRLKQMIEALPADVEQRSQLLSDELAKLNEILPKLEHKIAYQLYQSLVSFASHIAKASGGFLRFMSISKAEEKWIALPMIHPILPEEGDEEASE